MLLSTIVQAVTDRYTTETIATTTLERIIAAAVRWYSRFNPQVTTVDIPTVGDQQVYTLPVDCICIVGVDYWPSGGLSRELNASYDTEMINRRPASYDLVSERVIEDIKEAEHVDRVRGSYELRNKQLLLWPVPGATSVTVTVAYGIVHAMTGTLTTREYATIPAEDLEIVRDLAVAEIIEGKGVEYAIEPDYAEGLSRWTKHFIPGNIKATIEYLRGKCSQKYGQPVVLL